LKAAGFFQSKVVRPLLLFLKQGVTAQKLSLSAAFGLVLAIFPVLGSTTILCAAAALVLKLNMPAIQLVNYLAYPLQLLLLIPFLKAGQVLFQAPPLPFSLSQVIHLVKTQPLHAIALLWTATWHGMVVWAIVAYPLGWALYRAAFFWFSKAERKMRKTQHKG
jgi:uncharacterized protein (DUF2062 family)